MPSHKIHICIGEKIKEKHKFSDLFLLGCVIPDLCTTSHFKSHFKVTHSKYNIEKFINNYNLNNEVTFNIFTKEELDNLFNDCVNYIFSYLQNKIKHYNK